METLAKQRDGEQANKKRLLNPNRNYYTLQSITLDVKNGVETNELGQFLKQEKRRIFNRLSSLL